jgi:hypothetical protein
MNCSLDGLLMVVCFHPRQRAEVLLKPHHRQSSKTRHDWKPESSEQEWWEIFNILELPHTLSPISREDLLQQLSGWLVHSERSQDVTTKSALELEHLGDEIRMAWVRGGPLEKRFSASHAFSYADARSSA